MKRILMLAGVSVLLAAPVRGFDFDGLDQVSDPDMLAAVENADVSNLESAMQRGMTDAKKSAGHLRVIMFGSRRTLLAVLSELEGTSADAGPLADAVDSLEELETGFTESAVEAGLLSRTKAPPDELRRQRAGYRYHDRKEDLSNREKYLRKADKKRKVELPEEQTEVLGAADRFISELASVSESVAGTRKGLRGPVSKKLKRRLKRFKEDLEFLRDERRLLEVGLKLAQHDEAAFDVSE